MFNQVTLLLFLNPLYLLAVLALIDWLHACRQGHVYILAN